MGLLTQNSKMRKAGIRTYNWTLPAYRSRTGLTTCPAAGECARGCYAQQGAYTWSNVYPKHEANLELTRNSSKFLIEMASELGRLPAGSAVRIHDAGDFYSARYLEDWLILAGTNPGLQFYAYTKQVRLLEAVRAAGRIPRNLVLIYSEGGIFDAEIPAGARHSRVFSSLDELRAAGYDDATTDDSVAWRSESGRIGLVYHGAAGKKWTTSDRATSGAA
jgi:hypothetical protein